MLFPHKKSCRRHFPIRSRGMRPMGNLPEVTQALFCIFQIYTSTMRPMGNLPHKLFSVLVRPEQSPTWNCSLDKCWKDPISLTCHRVQWSKVLLSVWVQKINFIGNIKINYVFVRKSIDLSSGMCISQDILGSENNNEDNDKGGNEKGMNKIGRQWQCKSHLK